MLTDYDKDRCKHNVCDEAGPHSPNCATFGAIEAEVLQAQEPGVWVIRAEDGAYLCTALQKSDAVFWESHPGFSATPFWPSTAIPEGMALDAARYRALRRGQHWSIIDGIGNTLRAEGLDEAIDDVIAAAQGEQP